MQSYYPEELGCCLLVNVPYVFHLIWKLLSPVMDEQTTNKIKIINSNKLTEVRKLTFSDRLQEITQVISEDVLEKEYGGKNDYVFKWETYWN